MPKNIVICCDGTGNEFGTQNSNVVKLYSALDNRAHQVAYYHPGVGTIGTQSTLTRATTWVMRVIGLAFGYGISENIADAYQFLMRVYEEGDRVFVFGFSRGAYTARALCGLLYMVGLLTRGNESMIPYAIRLFRREPPPRELAAEFKRTFGRECRPHFVGVWDTVSSVGWVYNAVHFPFTRVNPDLRIVRHALAIDECRVFYRHNLFAPAGDGQDIQQVWFAGAHSDVGGSYDEAESGLSKIALRWMLAEAERAGLLVDPQRRAAVLGGQPPYAAPDPGAPMHVSLFGWWYLAEVWPKLITSREGRQLRINRGRRRRIPSTALIHESVLERMSLPATLELTGTPPRQRRRVVRYRPQNLRDPERYRVVSDVAEAASTIEGVTHDSTDQHLEERSGRVGTGVVET
jgi:uncharacterized protein (DUF2235 family)